MNASLVAGREAPNVDEQKELEAFSILVRSGTKNERAGAWIYAVLSLFMLGCGVVALFDSSTSSTDQGHAWIHIVYAALILSSLVRYVVRMRKGRRLQAEVSKARSERP
jgi:hypothetical protein